MDLVYANFEVKVIRSRKMRLKVIVLNTSCDTRPYVDFCRDLIGFFQSRRMFQKNAILHFWLFLYLHIIIKRGKVSVRTSVTVSMVRSVANDVTMTIAGLWRYGDWRHVATGCTALVMA